MPSLDVAIDLFLDHVKVERGLARNTVLAYGRDLAAFRRHAARAGVTEAEAVGRPRSCSPISSRSPKRAPPCARKHAGWSRCAASSVICAPSDTSRSIPPRTSSCRASAARCPRRSTDDEVDRAPRRRRIADDARGAARRRHARDALRDRPARLASWCALRLRDVESSERATSSTVGKGRKQRLVPLGERARDAHRRVRRARPPDARSGSRASATLFLTHRGRAHDAPGRSGSCSPLRARPPASASGSRRTSCATRSPPTSSSAAPTCARCRRCWATPTSARPRSTRTCLERAPARDLQQASPARLAEGRPTGDDSTRNASQGILASYVGRLVRGRAARRDHLPHRAGAEHLRARVRARVRRRQARRSAPALAGPRHAQPGSLTSIPSAPSSCPCWPSSSP